MGDLSESHNASLTQPNEVISLADATSDTLHHFEIAVNEAERRRYMGGSATASYHSTGPSRRVYSRSGMDTPGVRLEDLDELVIEEDPVFATMRVGSFQDARRVLQDTEILENEFKNELPDMYGRFWCCDPRASIVTLAAQPRDSCCERSDAALPSKDTKLRLKGQGRKKKAVITGASSTVVLNQPWKRPTRDDVGTFFGASGIVPLPSERPAGPVVKIDDSPTTTSGEPCTSSSEHVLSEVVQTSALHHHGGQPCADPSVVSQFPVRLVPAGDEPIDLCQSSTQQDSGVPAEPPVPRSNSPVPSFHSSGSGDLRMVGGKTIVFGIATPLCQSDAGSDGHRSVDSREVWEPF